MASIGQGGWPEASIRRRAAQNLADGSLHLASLGGEVVGTLAFQWEDARFWGDRDGTDGTAGYVHRLATRRARAGEGLGARLLGWADDQVRAAGRSCLRLDVVTGNAPLRAYYERLGFGYVRDLSGVAEFPDGTRAAWSTTLYERPVD